MAFDLGKCRNKTTTQLASQKIKNNIVGPKAPARVGKSLIGTPEKSFLTRSSNISTTRLITVAMMYTLQAPQTYNL